MVQFCLNRLDELISEGLIPYVVFDGADLPSKDSTNENRRKWVCVRELISRVRQSNMEIAQQKEREGKIDEASDYYYRALEISPDLYYPLIAQLKERNIQFMVSPYESDAQLGFLFRNNYIDLVITEDSDTLVYGCRRVLFKFKEGSGDEIDMSRLSACTKFDFRDWTHDMFTYLCVLAGCDYLPSLRGIGIIHAYQVVSRGRTPAGIFANLRGFTEVPAEYESGFTRAVFTFRHQTVFDPRRRAAVPLLPLPASLQAQPPAYLGPVLPADLAARIAAGEVDPLTHRPVGAMEEEDEEIGGTGGTGGTGETGEIRFSSPFVSISFRPLIERPSERGLPRKGDLSHLDFASGTAVKRAMVLESPPRKRPAVQRIGPSPVTTKCVNTFLDQFRKNLTQQ